MFKVIFVLLLLVIGILQVDSAMQQHSQDRFKTMERKMRRSFVEYFTNWTSERRTVATVKQYALDAASRDGNDSMLALIKMWLDVGRYLQWERRLKRKLARAETKILESESFQNQHNFFKAEIARAQKMVDVKVMKIKIWYFNMLLEAAEPQSTESENILLTIGFIVGVIVLQVIALIGCTVENRRRKRWLAERETRRKRKQRCSRKKSKSPASTKAK